MDKPTKNGIQRQGLLYPMRPVSSLGAWPIIWYLPEYDYWLKYYHQKNNPISECAQFKVYIQSILEERVAEIKELGYG